MSKEIFNCACNGSTFDLVNHLHRAKNFSFKTFGPGQRTIGVINHIKKELQEIEENPTDIKEWIDVIILGMDGALRAGYTPEQVAQALLEKQNENENRNWPDWRLSNQETPIEHVRENKKL